MIKTMNEYHEKENFFVDLACTYNDMQRKEKNEVNKFILEEINIKCYKIKKDLNKYIYENYNKFHIKKMPYGMYTPYLTKLGLKWEKNNE